MPRHLRAVHTLEQVYPADFSTAAVYNNLPQNFKNPFDGTTGNSNAFEDRANWNSACTAKSGLASYGDTLQQTTTGLAAYNQATGRGRPSRRPGPDPPGFRPDQVGRRPGP